MYSGVKDGRVLRVCARLMLHLLLLGEPGSVPITQDTHLWAELLCVP